MCILTSESHLTAATMKTATSMLAAGLCLWASIAAVSSATVDSSTLDRMINSAVALRDDDAKFTKAQYRAALEAQRPCLAKSFATLDAAATELFLSMNERTLECLNIGEGADLKQLSMCLKHAASLMNDENDPAEDAFEKCDPDN